MKKLLLGLVLGSGLIISFRAFAEPLWTPNPLFDPLPVGKDGLSLVSYTQEQKDMTILYGRLDYITQQLNQLQAECGKR